MAKNAEYKIIINGLQESITQVDALNKGLDALEKKIGELEKKNININATTTTTSTQKVDNSALQEQDKLTKDIWATQQKINDARDKDYQELVRLKDELKAAKTEAEGLAAASKLDENNYNLNTMEGIKEKLKDIKREINTTDIGSDQFKKLTEEANELNTKLKDIEQSYGQFGRNVGNYASAAEGFDKLRIQVGNTTREFDNAREALKSLKNERDTLALMGKDFKDIDLVVKQLQSSIKDMSMSSAGMDNLLDTMQSIIAISSTAKGIGAVFGMDNDKIEETIKKLVALQNVMQGIETIQKQIQTQEGIGKWLATGSKAIDSFSTKMFGAKKAAEGAAAGMKTATKASKLFGTALKGLGIGLIISAIAYLVENWEELDKSIQEAIPWTKQFGGVLGSLQAIFKGVGKAIVNWFINPIQTSIKIFKNLLNLNLKGAWQSYTDGISKQFKGTADAFKSAMDDAREDQIRKDKAAEAEKLTMQMEMLEAQYGNEVKYTEQYRKLLKERNRLLKESLDPNSKTYSQDLYKLQIEEAKQNKDYEDNAKQQYEAMLQKQKEYAQKVKEADEELTRLRIDNMKEGLNKTLTQLEEERKARINKARETGINVRETEAEINRYYDNEEQKAREQYQEQVIESYRKMYNDIANLRAENERQILANMESELDNTLNRMESQKFDIIGDGFGSGWGRERTDKSMFTYGFDLNYKQMFNDETLGKIEEYKFILQQLVIATDELSAAEEHLNGLINIGDEEGIQYWQKEVDKLKEVKEAAENARISFEKLNGGDISKLVFLTEDNKDAVEVFNRRISTIEDFYNRYIGVATDSQDRILEQRKESLRAEKDAELSSLRERLREFGEQNSQAMNDELNSEKWSEEKKLEIQEKYQEILRQYYQQYATQRDQIIQKYKNEEIKAEQDKSDKIKSINEKQYQEILTELRDFQTEANNVISKNPVYNSFGIYHFKANNDNFDKAKSMLNKALTELGKQKENLDKKWEDGLISDEAYQNTAREINRMVSANSEALAKIEDESKQAIPKFVESISVYTQAFAQTLSGILQATWDAQDAAYEKQKEDLQKQTEDLEKQLDKQKEITEKYKDDINDIEDELSTARGDRRQELIDQLNAEKAAQRAALAEKKRIEREEERLKEKADKLDKDQRDKQKDRDLITAGINASMAILGAAANHWPLPALPLVAAATALGTAQIAAIKSKKYATGGVIEGPRHIRGGVKVLGGRAEVEGGEYITNRQTTMKNVELLEYINAKKKRIDLQDMVEFFDSGARRTIKSISPARKFAEGGELPMLNESLTINDRLLSAFERYAERPSVVSVVEIEDRMDDVNAVRALAGVD